MCPRMYSGFKGKIVLVTGAGRGIGRACALAFGALGCKLVLVSRTASELEATAKLLPSQADDSMCICADVSEELSVQSVFQQVEDRWGGVDILVNNAAVFSKADVVKHGVQEWDFVFGVNVRGVFLCSRELFRGCEKTRRSASIVNVSSLGGIRGTEKFPGLSSYVASKHAVVGLTESLAVEGRSLGIRVNCIAPGAVDTEMLRRAAPHLKTQTTPEQIAKTVVMLSDEAQSSHLTGSVIEIWSNAH